MPPFSTCERCGAAFHQVVGRPSKRCRACRSGKYGPEHRRIRAATLESAYGQPCARCGEVMARGQRLELDHAEDGGYLGPSGFSHEHCNRSAGGEKRRAQLNGHAAPTCAIHVPARRDCPHSRAW
ncbi:hypothetical protein ABN034_19345 [Actinopolymorpha sp. B11F2]|uniref:hypothetical protein n=1 Tax=Actinopolymorpha sp. B11F2 TaxID=3160862 RepID=UPI0032E525F0